MLEITSIGTGFGNRGVEVRHAFKSWKAASYSSSHLSLYLFFKALKNDMHLSIDLERNRLRAVVLPVSLCIFVVVAGSFILRMALILLGWASMPLWVTSIPKIDQMRLQMCICSNSTSCSFVRAGWRLRQYNDTFFKKN